MQRAIKGAARHTPAEIRELMAPMVALTAAMCAGVATEEQYRALRVLLDIALFIERGRLGRGRAGHFVQALHAMDAMADRARSGGAWQHGMPQFHEADSLREAIPLHEHQVRHISPRDLHLAVTAFAKRFRVQLEHVTLPDVGLQSETAVTSPA